VNQAETLGLQLVTNLARQLHGGLDVETGPEGTAFTIRFPLPAPFSCGSLDDPLVPASA